MSAHCGPNIVEDGLVLCLDAGNIRSYPGNGTLWTDLSESGNDGTLINGAVYNTNNKGSFTFDKVNDYCSVVPINRGTSTTLDVWFNTTSVSTNIAIRQYLYTQQQNPPTLAVYTYQQRHGIHIAGDLIHFQYFTTDNGNETLATANGLISANKWFNVSATLDNSISKIYINGNLSIEKTGKAAKATIVNQGYIGIRLDANATDIFGGQISSVKEYSRALSSQEIKQNFEATRRRYGL
jgi:hypothetical protein